MEGKAFSCCIGFGCGTFMAYDHKCTVLLSIWIVADRTFLDFYRISWNVNTSERLAAFKCIGVNLGYIFWDGDVFKFTAVYKCTIYNTCQSFW